jgi:hypothetical protein
MAKVHGKRMAERGNVTETAGKHLNRDTKRVELDVCEDSANGW